MSKYHLFSNGNGTDYLGWCYREVLPLRVAAEGHLWETAARVSTYRVRGKGWEAVEDGHLSADEIIAKNRRAETEAERRKAGKGAAKAAQKGVGKGGAAALKVTATDVKSGNVTEYWSIREAAAALRVNKTTMARYARSGEPFGGYVFKIEERAGA